MLVLGRSEGQGFKIKCPDGAVIHIKYLGFSSDFFQHKIGIDAPKEYNIVRDELLPMDDKRSEW